MQADDIPFLSHCDCPRTVRRDFVDFVHPQVELQLDSFSITNGTLWDVPSFLLSHGLCRDNLCKSFESGCLKPCLRMSVLWSIPTNGVRGRKWAWTYMREYRFQGL